MISTKRCKLFQAVIDQEQAQEEAALLMASSTRTEEEAEKLAARKQSRVRGGIGCG